MSSVIPAMILTETTGQHHCVQTSLLILLMLQRKCINFMQKTIYALSKVQGYS